MTHYKVSKTNDRYSLVEVNLETGRKHQIRVHLSRLGCPIIGDKIYGASKSPAERSGVARLATGICPSNERAGELNWNRRCPMCCGALCESRPEADLTVRQPWGRLPTCPFVLQTYRRLPCPRVTFIRRLPNAIFAIPPLAGLLSDRAGAA